MSTGENRPSGDDPGAQSVLSDDELAAIDAYWRAANYLTIGQIYLKENPLLREPLIGCGPTLRKDLH